MRQEIWKERVEPVLRYLDAGLGRSEIAERLGISLRTVHTYAARSGYEVPDDKRLAKIRDCAERGLTRAEAAAELGISVYIVGRYGRECAIPFRRASSTDFDPRSEPMASMYKAGRTLEEIGAVYSITRERVRQILKKYHGIVGADGGQVVRAFSRKKKAKAARDSRFMEQYGCSYAEYRGFVALSRKIQDAGLTYYRAPLGAYRSQRRNAKIRNIEWSISLPEWWDIWQKSGKWNLRGRGQGYMMCRFGDAGPYAIGNVYIATGVHNGAIQPNNPYRLSHPRHAETVEHRRVAA